MENVSSSTTLFFKYLFPTVWIVFFGTITIFVLVQDQEKSADLFGFSRPGNFKMGLLAFFATGVGLLYYFFMRLKRVEMDEDYIYVTNYFKIYKYPYHNIDRIEVRSFLNFRPSTLYFKEEGTFGKKISFLAGRYFFPYLDSHPDVLEKIKVERFGINNESEK